MTFCLAFAANPDGIAVVADTRITLARGFRDDFQKVIFPTDNSFVAIAGSVQTATYVLDGISRVLSPVIPEVRLDRFRDRLTSRYREMAVSMAGLSSDAAASIIYGDVRLKKGPTRCRLVKFDLGASESGRPVVSETSAARFAEKQAQKFPADPPDHLPWVCIGAYQSLLEFVGNTAMDHLRSLLRRRLELEPADKSLAKGGALYQQAEMRAAASAHTPGAMILDTNGSEDGSFRKELRRYANQGQARDEGGWIDPIFFLGMTAMKRTADQIEELRAPGAIHVDTIGDTWSLATISRRSGIKLSSSPDPNGGTARFGITDKL